MKLSKVTADSWLRPCKLLKRFLSDGNERRHVPENLELGERRRKIYNQPFGGDNVFCSNNRLAAHYNRIKGYVTESLAGGWRQTIAGNPISEPACMGKRCVYCRRFYIDNDKGLSKITINWF